MSSFSRRSRPEVTNGGQDGRFALTIGKDSFADDGLDSTRDPEKKAAMSNAAAQEQMEVVDKDTDDGGYLRAMTVGKDSFADDGLDSTRDPESFKKQQQQAAAGASDAELRAEGQHLADEMVSRPTTLEEYLSLDLPTIPYGTILRFAFSPNNLGDLNLAHERMKVGEVASVLSINNPTPELMKHLIQTGQFTDAIFSGHGDEDGIFITAEDGSAQHMTSEQVGDLLKDSSVHDVLLNMCDGGQKTDEVLNELGIATMAHSRSITDGEGADDAVAFAEAQSVYGVDDSDGAELGHAKPPEAPKVHAEPRQGENPVIAWQAPSNNSTKGFNVYRNDQYVTTVKDAHKYVDTDSTSLDATYQVTAFDIYSRYSGKSDGVTAEGDKTVAGDTGTAGQWTEDKGWIPFEGASQEPEGVREANK